MRHALLSALVFLSASGWSSSSSAGCAGVTPTMCFAVRDICYATLDIEPISCGVWYGCCDKQTPGTGDLADICRQNPCSSSCPLSSCMSGLVGTSSQGLTVGQATLSTNVAPTATAAGMLSAIVAKGNDGSVSYNWWALGQGQRGWQKFEGDVRTDVAPAGVSEILCVRRFTELAVG